MQLQYVFAFLHCLSSRNTSSMLFDTNLCLIIEPSWLVHFVSLQVLSHQPCIGALIREVGFMVFLLQAMSKRTAFSPISPSYLLQWELQLVHVTNGSNYFVSHFVF